MRPDSMPPMRTWIGLGWLLFAFLSAEANAQQPYVDPMFSSTPYASVPLHSSQGSKIGGLKVNLPVVPGTSPRGLEGMGDVIATSGGQGSVASFIDSIHKKDAAFSVIVGQARILTLKERVADEEGKSVVAIGDPTIADFQPLPNPRLFRVIGMRPGVTDFSFTNANDETVSLEIHVTYDIPLLQARLRQLFPDAYLRLGQLRDHLVVEGQARSNAQVSRILEMLNAYLLSMSAEQSVQGQAGQPAGAAALPNGLPPQNADSQANTSRPQADDELEDVLANPELSPSDQASDESTEGEDEEDPPALPASLETGGASNVQVRRPAPQVINLLRVPGTQQVLLKVKIAELNRTAVREVGADILGVDSSTGTLLGTQIGGAAISASGAAGLGGLLGTGSGELGTSNTAFGIFPSGDWQIIMRALRQNGFVRVLAEPNLVAMSGHRANFLAGGEFPVPIPQATGAGNNSVTVDFREFGVRLDFLPFIVDEDRIRLSVTPEVSTIDFTLGTTLVAGGDPVPGLNTRRANTTVEMKPGQTLAMAGLMQVELGGQSGRIPGLGDLPYIGPFFSNTSHRRVEKELLVLVTPYFVEPLDNAEGLPLPGDEVEDPTDNEFYFRNQYEGTTGVRHRSTVDYWPQQPQEIIVHDQRVMSGPIGFGR